MTELGVRTAPYEKPKHPMRFEWDGRAYRFDDVRDLPDSLLAGLSDVERKASPLGVVHALVEGATAPGAGDPRSGIEWLRALGLTPAGEKFVRAFVPLPLDSVPAPVFHRLAMREVQVSLSDTIAGGTDMIVEGLAARHARRITKGIAIASVRQDESGVVSPDAQGRSFTGSRPRSSACRSCRCARSGSRAACRRRSPRGSRRSRRRTSRKLVEGVRTSRASMSSRERRVTWRLPETSASGVFVTQTLAWEPEVARPAAGAAANGLLGTTSRRTL